jgi:hypothetical protein
MEKSFFKNCLDVHSTPDGLLPLRFTERQLNVFDADPNFRVRSLSCAGVTLDVLTDAEGFELDYKIHGRARDFHFVDVCLEGTLIACHGSASPVESFSFRQDLPASQGKLRRLTLYLPYASHVTVRRFELLKSSIAQPAPAAKKRLLCLGDSITQGMDAKHPSSTYAVLFSRALGMEFINQGLGGDCFRAESLDPEFPFTPDLITVAFGSNDWSKTALLGEITDNCGEYLRKLSGIFPKTPIVVITPIWRADRHEKRPSGTLQDVIHVIEGVCAALPRIKTIRGLDLCPHLTEYMGDGRLHPSDEGFLHMTLNLVRALKTP